mmetsp:Transcript_45874/g.110429  ORF Transcript_45874/g.110429 Transcript_45874/m.110429 type:complete len:253 (-) Transcript_45874:619-1377(-)
MRVTLEQLIREHNCFSDVKCDEWLVTHIVMTGTLGSSPHPEWRSWIQVMGPDFEAKHRDDPTAFGWKQLCECIETREDTMLITYTKTRESNPEANFTEMIKTGTRAKHHCKYHGKEVAHTEDECTLNPANKDKKQELDKKKKAEAEKKKAEAENKNGKPSHDLRDIVCWTCGEKGHIVTLCPKKENKKDESASFAFALGVDDTPSDSIVKDTPSDSIVNDTPSDSIVDDTPSDSIDDDTPSASIVYARFIVS